MRAATSGLVLLRRLAGFYSGVDIIHRRSLRELAENRVVTADMAVARIVKWSKMFDVAISQRSLPNLLLRGRVSG